MLRKMIYRSFRQRRHTPLLFSVLSLPSVVQNPFFFGFSAFKIFLPQRTPSAALHRGKECYRSFRRSRHTPLLFSVLSLPSVVQNPFFFGFSAFKIFLTQRTPSAALHRGKECYRSFRRSRHTPLLFSVLSLPSVVQNPFFFGFSAFKSFLPQRTPSAALHRGIALNWQGVWL
jgi:hypothetical protein